MTNIKWWIVYFLGFGIGIGGSARLITITHGIMANQTQCFFESVPLIIYTEAVLFWVGLGCLVVSFFRLVGYVAKVDSYENREAA